MKAPSWRTTLRVIAILAWLVSIVWLIVEPGFDPLITFLTGTASFLLSLKVSDEPITRLPTSALTPEQQQRNRRNMLQLVWNTWIEGYLEKSLYNEVLIELVIEKRPDIIERPWDMGIQMQEDEARLVLPGITILNHFDQTNGSLLILGEPGSGKTTLLLELTRQAIQRAYENPEQPIPVVFNLSSWTPKFTFSEWLVQELSDRYYVSQKIGDSWVNNDDLLLLLDGLDEVRTEYRIACIQAINSFIQVEHNIPLAVCCRQQEYEAIETHLKLRGAVLIQPLTLGQVNDYLQKAGPSLLPVHRALQKDPRLLEFASTPLVLSIIAMAFHNAKAETIQELETADNLRQKLFDVYIRQMFRWKGIKLRYTPERMVSWLAWLARKMKYGKTLLYIEDIHMDWVPDSQRTLIPNIKNVVGLIFGLAVLLIFGMIFGLLPGLISGLIFGLRVRLEEWERNANSPGKLAWDWQEARKGLITGLIAGSIFGLIGGLLAGLNVGLIVGLITPVYIALTSGLRGLYVMQRNTPAEVLWACAKNTLIAILIFGLLPGLIFGLYRGLLPGLFFGLYMGLYFGLDYGGFFLIAHFTIRYLLSNAGYVPWNLINFLDYAANLIFLRKLGGGYIFIHRMLMEHFAAIYDEQFAKEKV